MAWFAPLIPSDPQALAALDYFLHGLHFILIAFVVTGWMFASLRRLHLLVLGIVWLSWLGLGLYVRNFGYCLLTDWQWQVKTALGETNLPPSYLEYLYWRLTGSDVDNEVMSWIAAIVLVLSTLLSLAANRREDEDEDEEPATIPPIALKLKRLP